MWVPKQSLYKENFLSKSGYLNQHSYSKFTRKWAVAVYAVAVNFVCSHNNCYSSYLGAIPILCEQHLIADTISKVSLDTPPKW